MDLFLLNYKHITIEAQNKLIVEDLFRIITEPKKDEKTSSLTNNGATNLNESDNLHYGTSI